MPPAENGGGVRESRSSRRRPGISPPKVKQIRPRSGLSRAEVIADQRQRIFEGLAFALAYHGYEDTRITDIVELAGISRPTFYEHFDGKDSCFAAAYGDGVERLSGCVESAARGERGWPGRLSAGLSAGLDFLASNPSLAHLLLVESLAASRPARFEHERTLTRLAQALRRPPTEPLSGGTVSEETARLLAGGLASHLSGRVLAGESERLPESHDLLLRYLLAPSPPAASRGAAERPAARV
jgi:AcrR family transcriptional regulator